MPVLGELAVEGGRLTQGQSRRALTAGGKRACNMMGTEAGSNGLSEGQCRERGCWRAGKEAQRDGIPCGRSSMNRESGAGSTQCFQEITMRQM